MIILLSLSLYYRPQAGHKSTAHQRSQSLQDNGQEQLVYAALELLLERWGGSRAARAQLLSHYHTITL